MAAKSSAATRASGRCAGRGGDGPGADRAQAVLDRPHRIRDGAVGGVTFYVNLQERKRLAELDLKRDELYAKRRAYLKAQAAGGGVAPTVGSLPMTTADMAPVAVETGVGESNLTESEPFRFEFPPPVVALTGISVAIALGLVRWLGGARTSHWDGRCRLRRADRLCGRRSAAQNRGGRVVAYDAALYRDVNVGGHSGCVCLNHLRSPGVPSEITRLLSSLDPQH